VTSYEAGTALALLHFAEERVDVAVLEVGLGGRLDATNAVPATVAVLTPIALDHTETLGATVAAIAAEKADVIGPGAIAVCAPQAPEALAVIERVAATRGSELRLAGDGAARQEGINALGPFPPDTVFYRAHQGEFDGVMAMYHDQGHIPMKLLGFDRGVNVTVGLPIVCTSVGHGTAFDIAGKGIASETSLVEAIRVAARLARHRMAHPKDFLAGDGDRNG
jgi:hypothetical protein